MPERTDVTYVYDGSLQGLLCCIFESFQKKEQPVDIQTNDTAQMTLYMKKVIDTDNTKADRVRDGIIRMASADAYDMVEYGFHSCHPQKERLILRFVYLAMEHGSKALCMLTNETVETLVNAVNALLRESEKLKGFVRFSDHDGVMVAIIEPKNYVLPLLAPHFCDRFSNEAFMICDKTHGDALLYRAGQTVIVPLMELNLPNADEQEIKFRSLWKLFYDTIAIEQRYNPACRMSFMPKRYWKHLTEMNGEGAPTLAIDKNQEMRRIEQADTARLAE